MAGIGIFGGTFDPIHMGHIRLAKSAVRECHLDKLLFMPNFISPFKQGTDVSSANVRCEMIQLILHMDNAFDITYYEFERSEPSYTYDTLKFFRENYRSDIYFVMGYDSLYDLDTWYMGKELLSEYRFIAGRRPGTDDKKTDSKVEKYRKDHNADISILDMEPFNVSSSEIRTMIRNDESIDGLVPIEVIDYIEQHGLYR